MPFKVALLYAALAALWILVSDALILALTDNPTTLTRLQGIKGWFFVVVTALLLYLVLRRYLTALNVSVLAQQRSEDRYQRILDAAHEGIWILDAQQNTTYVNQHMAAMLGYTMPEMVSRSRLDFVDEALHPALQQHFERRVRGLVDSYEFRFRRKDGTPLWAIVSSTPITDAQGRFAGVLAMVTDISGRKRVEDRLRLSTERLSTLHEIDRGILEIRAPQEIAQVALARLRKLMPHCQRGSVGLFDWENRVMSLQAVHMNGETYHGQGRTFPLATLPYLKELQAGALVYLPDLTTLTEPALSIRTLMEDGMRCVVALPISSGGELIGALNLSATVPHAFTEADVEIAREVADQLAIAVRHTRLNQQLTATNTELQTALRAKDEMLANVSHELRTPLTHIMGYADLLADGALGPLEADQSHAIEIIQSQSAALSRLVSQLISLQMLTPDQFEWTSVDLAQILHGTLPRWSARAQKARVTIETEIAENLSRVRGDYDKLSHVVNNLLENAIKFMPGGGTVTVRLAQEGDAIHLSVQDGGIGIAPENLSKIFYPFFQVDGSSTRRFGGAGIGLTLAEKVIMAHGGRIWAESEGIPGRGTTIHVTLPVPSLATP